MCALVKFHEGDFTSVDECVSLLVTVGRTSTAISSRGRPTHAASERDDLSSCVGPRTLSERASARGRLFAAGAAARAR